MIIFTRHVATQEESNKIIKGWLPIGLSDEGKSQALDLAQTILNLDIKFKRIISSDLRRSVETAEILADKLVLPIEKIEILRERNAGEAAGKTEDQIDWIEYERQPIEHRKHLRGESLLEVRARARQFLEQQSDDDVIVVSHDAFIKMIVSLVQNKDIADCVNINLNRTYLLFDNRQTKLKLIQY